MVVPTKSSHICDILHNSGWQKCNCSEIKSIHVSSKRHSEPREDRSKIKDYKVHKAWAGMNAWYLLAERKVMAREGDTEASGFVIYKFGGGGGSFSRRTAFDHFL